MPSRSVNLAYRYAKIAPPFAKATIAGPPLSRPTCSAGTGPLHHLPCPPLGFQEPPLQALDKGPKAIQQLKSVQAPPHSHPSARPFSPRHRRLLPGAAGGRGGNE